MSRAPALFLALLVACSGSGTPATAPAGSATAPGSVTSASAPTTTAAEAPASTDAATTTTSVTVSTTTGTTLASLSPEALTIEAFPVPAGSRPHDVAPAADGGVWYTAQGSGELGWLDPVTGETRHIPLGPGSRPHGVIVDNAGVAWVTDGGLNSIVAVDPVTSHVTVYPLPDERPDANLNTAVFDADGLLWFTGQNGIYGSLDPVTGEMLVYDAPRGRGPYGITATDQAVFFASLAGSYVGAIQPDGSALVVEPPIAAQGARRVWADSGGAIWVSEWNSGSLSRYRPSSREWDTWPLPGEDPAAYAVFVDDADVVWVSDFGANAMVRFDPFTETFTSYPLPHDPGDVRQILGRPGEVWGAESAADHLVLIKTR